MSKQRDDYDNPWKEAIAVYFKSFIAFGSPGYLRTNRLENPPRISG